MPSIRSSGGVRGLLGQLSIAMGLKRHKLAVSSGTAVQVRSTTLESKPRSSLKVDQTAVAELERPAWHASWWQGVGNACWEALSAPRVQLVLTLLLITAIFFVRRPDQFINPQMCAEDATLLFLGDREFGLQALTMPYAGYLILVPRLIAAVGGWVDVLWLPRFYCMAALACVLVSSAAIMQARIEMRCKALAALALVSVPHNGEVFMNIANLQWILSPLLLVLALQQNPRSLREAIFDILALILLGLTGPFSVLWLPFLVLRPIVFGRTWYNFVFAVLAVGTAALQFFHMHVTSLEPHLPSTGSGISPVRGIAEYFTTKFANNLFLGTTRLTTWNFAILGAIALTAIYILVAESGRIRIRGLAILAAGGIVFIASIARVRYNLGILEPAMRYQYVPAVMIVWFFLLGLSSRWTSASIAAGIVLILIFCATTRHPKRGQLEDLHWSRSAERIRQGQLEGLSVSVPVNPGWEMTVSPRNAANVTMPDEARTLSLLWQNPKCEQRAVPIMPPLEMWIVNPAEAIHHVDVRLSNFGMYQPGVVRFEILTEAGETLAQPEIVAAEVLNNQFNPFDLREPIRAKGQRLRFRLTYVKAPSESGLVVGWSSATDDNTVICRVLGN